MNNLHVMTLSQILMLNTPASLHFDRCLSILFWLSACE